MDKEFRMVTKLPATQSWFFMPMIYIILNNNKNITYPTSFQECLDKTFELNNNIFGSETDITTYEQIIDVLNKHMHSLNVKSIDDLCCDAPFHIKGRDQEILLNYDNEFFNVFFNTLMNNIIELAGNDKIKIQLG